MTNKNLKPQQAAPVQREINTTSNAAIDVGMITPLFGVIGPFPIGPFAGDDAE